jgi:hypothetical protein
MTPDVAGVISLNRSLAPVDDNVTARSMSQSHKVTMTEVSAGHDQQVGVQSRVSSGASHQSPQANRRQFSLRRITAAFWKPFGYAERIPKANLCEEDQMVLSQTQASSEFPVPQGDQEAPFRGERATISEEKIPHTHTMKMGRAEDMERRLDETTKTGSAASVASVELKGELSSPSLQATSRARAAPDRSFLKSSLYSDFTQ